MLSGILKYACYACIAAMPLGGIPHKVPTGVHVLTIRTCWTDQNLMQFLMHSQHRKRENHDRSSEIASKRRTVVPKTIDFSIGNAKCRPFVRKCVEKLDRRAENGCLWRTGLGQRVGPNGAALKPLSLLYLDLLCPSPINSCTRLTVYTSVRAFYHAICSCAPFGALRLSAHLIGGGC